MPDGAETPAPRRGRKYAQVLEGARTVFMADGFEGASVDDIARAAGVSKATLYSYFADKRLLFMEVARSECARQANMAADSIDTDAPVAQVLTEAARQMIAIAVSDFGRQMVRIAASEAVRFPALGAAFYDRPRRRPRPPDGLFRQGRRAWGIGDPRHGAGRRPVPRTRQGGDHRTAALRPGCRGERGGTREDRGGAVRVFLAGYGVG